MYLLLNNERIKKAIEVVTANGVRVLDPCRRSS
jgi:hypothetical protein